MTDDSPPTVYHPISLGYACQTKFQIARALNARDMPGHSEMRLRLEMTPPGRGARHFGWDVFDWLGVSLAAVTDYIAREFQGVYERDDLIIEDDIVYHRQYRTVHDHDYEAMREQNGVLSPERLDAAYPSERKKFDARAAAFLQRLHTPGDFLYIHENKVFPSAAQIQALLGLLTARSPDHRVHLLLIGQDTPPDYASPAVTTAQGAAESGKPKGREWEGEDDSWANALQGFALGMPGLAAKAAPAPPAPAAAASPAKPEGGLFSRLFSRGR